MKSPKKPSQEPPLPSQDESRRTNVLFEKLLSEFRTFGEGQSIMRERLDRMEPDLHAVKEDVAILKTAVRTNSQDISDLKVAVHGNSDAINANTVAIRSMQADLKNFNHRLEVVESKVAS